MLTRHRITLLALATILASLGAPTAAIAQSMNDLRRDNERLRQRIEELEAQLAQARAIIERLERTTAQLRNELRGSDGSEASGEEGGAAIRETAPVPGDPFAAPEAMYQHLLDRHQEEVVEAEDAKAPDIRSPEQAARRWARIVSQRVRQPVEWTIRVLELSETEGRDYRARVEVLDPASGLPIGDPFEITLRMREASRIQEQPLQERWILSGVFGASPRVVSDEEQSRLFGKPRMIGERIEFGWEFLVRSVRAVRSAQEE